MAEKTSGLSAYWGKLQKRERMIVAVTLVAVVSWLLYQFPFLMQERGIKSLETGVRTTERELHDLAALVAELTARKSESGGVSPGWELADQKSVILLLEDVSGEAKRFGINLVAIHPTREIDKVQYKEVSLNLDLKGRYRALADYFKRIEGLSKVVNIRKIKLESCPDASSVCAVQVEAVTYMAK